MRRATRTRLAVIVRITFALTICAGGLGRGTAGAFQQASPATTPSAGTHAIGAVTAVAPDAVTIKTDAGAEMKVLVGESTPLVRTAPGEKTLKDAQAIKISDVHVGDRILVRGDASGDAKSMQASTVIVMARADIEKKQAQDREDWNKRGVGGIVKSVDAAGGIVTISTSALGASKPLAIHAATSTAVRRYAPGSARFDEAKAGTLDQIRPGDQLRARGARSADGSELAADEIVSGAFQNIAGTIAEVNSGAGTFTVTDLKTRKRVLVSVTGDSQVRQLPTFLAQRIAMRLHGGTPVATPGGPGGGAPAAPPPAAAPGASGASGSSAADETAGSGHPSDALPPGQQLVGRPARLTSAAPMDLQQMLSRLPAATLADLHAGDAVMIVATEETAPGKVTAITLLSGVDAILAASPKGSPEMFLTPWNLASSGPAGSE
jgi:hypothetical protein